MNEIYFERFYANNKLKRFRTRKNKNALIKLINN